MRISTLFLTLGISIFCHSASSTQALGNNYNNTFNDNMRWSVDLASRYIDKENSGSFFQNAIGLDVHKVFTSDTGNIGTLVFQPYVVNFSQAQKAPYFFDGNASELTWRIATFNYTALSNGQFNIRVGHLEIPYGLEQNIDTNGTLRQFTPSNRGIKADWGMSFNGALPLFEYEVSLTRGSGNDITDRNSPYVMAGRIGTASSKNIVAGFSFFQGEVLNATNTILRRSLGVDVAWYHYSWEYLLEISTGESADTRTIDALAEVSWRNRSESVHSYMQFRQFQTTLDGFSQSGNSVTFGLDWSAPYNSVVSAQWTKPLNTPSNKQDASTLLLQVRIRI